MNKTQRACFVVLILVTLSFTGCCKTVARIDVVRGTVPPSEKTGGAKEVFVCPGEPVTLGWLVSNDVSVASINTLGNVAVPKGYKEIKPYDDTKYTIEASGECKVTDYCQVNVVKEGDKAQITANLVEVPQEPTANLPKQYYWTTLLKDDVWSPNITFTSIRMVKFSEETWNQAASWRFLKTDPSGDVHDFPVRWEFTTPWPSPVIALGNWKIFPVGGVYPNNPPPFATFEVTMNCK